MSLFLYFVIISLFARYNLYILYIMIYFIDKKMFFNLENVDQYLSFLIFALPIILIFSKYKNTSISEVLLLKTIKKEIIIYLLFMIIPIYIIGTVIYDYANFVINIPTNFNYIKHNSNVIVAINTFALMPAICEELFFRGFLISFINNLKFSVFTKIILISISFAFSHIFYEQIIFTFVLSIIFTYITIITKSVIPAIILHFCFNILSIQYFYEFFHLYIFENLNLFYKNIFLIVSIIIVFLLLDIIKKIYNKN